MSDKTGNSAIIDVVAASIPTMKKHIEFVVNHTKAFIMIDSHPAQIGAEGHSCKGTKLRTTSPIPVHLRFAQEAGSDSHDCNLCTEIIGFSDAKSAKAPH